MTRQVIVIHFQFRNAYVSRDRAQENDGYHNTEENDDHNRVDNTEPVYSWVENVQVIVPTCSLEEVDVKLYSEKRVHVPMAYLIPDRNVKFENQNMNMAHTFQVIRYV